MTFDPAAEVQKADDCATVASCSWVRRGATQNQEARDKSDERISRNLGTIKRRAANVKPQTAPTVTMPANHDARSLADAGAHSPPALLNSKL